MGWVVNATPRPLYPREKTGTHYIGGPVWMGAENLASTINYNRLLLFWTATSYGTTVTPQDEWLSKIGGMIIGIALGTLRSQFYLVDHKPYMDCPGTEGKVTKRLSSGTDQPSAVRLDVTAAVQAWNKVRNVSLAVQRGVYILPLLTLPFNLR